MSATTASHTFPPIVCAPWCSDGDGHPGEHPDDQRCASESLRTVQTLAPQWESGGSWYPHEIEVFAKRGPQHVAAVVVYEVGEDVYLDLTAQEARALAAHLIASAELIET